MALSSKRKSSSSASNAPKPTFRRASGKGSAPAARPRAQRAPGAPGGARAAGGAGRSQTVRRTGGFAARTKMNAPAASAAKPRKLSAKPAAKVGATPSARSAVSKPSKAAAAAKPQKRAAVARPAASPKPKAKPTPRAAAGSRAGAQARPAAGRPAGGSKKAGASLGTRAGKAGSTRLSVSARAVAAARGSARAAAAPAAGEKRGAPRIKLPAIAVPGRIVAAIAAIALVLVVGGIVVTNSPLFAVTEVVVEGSDHISQEAAERLVDVPDGSTMFSIDTASIESSLKKNPWVESVKVERTFPHTVTITPVEYRVAAIAYITSSDVAWALDGNGTWIAPVSLSVTVDAEGNVVSGTAGTQAAAQDGDAAAADGGSGADGAGGADAGGAMTDDGSGDGAGDVADGSGDADGANDDAADGAGDAADASNDVADDADGAASDDASTDGSGDAAAPAADGTQVLTGESAALALARQSGAVLFTDITADVDPSEGASASAEVITAGLQYVNGFSSDFLAQIRDLSLESVDAISANLTSGIEVALGEPEDIDLKERVITGLLDQVQGITYIDARNPESPTYRSAPSA